MKQGLTLDYWIILSYSIALQLNWSLSIPSIPDVTMCNLIIRRAKTIDAAEIAVCLSALGYGTTCGMITERLVSYADSSTDVVVVASGGDFTSLLGVVSVHLLPLFHTTGLLGRITSLAADPLAQGNCVGRALVLAAEQWAWSKGAQRMEVTSGDHRSAAHAFYQAVGYLLDERRFIKHAAEAS